jgi:hypothetical protein
VHAPAGTSEQRPAAEKQRGSLLEELGEKAEQLEARKAVKALLRKVYHARESDEHAEAEQLLEAAGSVLPRLSEADRRWVDQEIRTQRTEYGHKREVRKPHRQEPVNPRQAQIEMSQWLDMALEELEKGNLEEARQCHAMACEMFGKIPLKDVNVARQRLDQTRQIIEDPRPVVAGRRVRPPRPARIRLVASPAAGDLAGRVAPDVRRLLEDTARRQSLTTWRQLGKGLGRELPTDPPSRRSILIKVDQDTAPDEPLLSALIMTGDSEMHPLYPDIVRALGRRFDPTETGRHLQWSMDVLRVHRTWRYR